MQAGKAAFYSGFQCCMFEPYFCTELSLQTTPKPPFVRLVNGVYVSSSHLNTVGQNLTNALCFSTHPTGQLLKTDSRFTSRPLVGNIEQPHSG